MSEPPTGTLVERTDFREFAAHLESVVVWSGDQSGFEYMSPAFEEIWGRPVEDALADMSTVIEGTHPEDRDRVVAAIEDREERLADGEPIQFEHRVLRPDGEVRWVEARIFPIHDDSGELSEVIGVTIDVTDRKRAEIEITRQNERLNRFAQILSHDLRNPLTTARGYLELFVEDRGGHEYLRFVERALDRMDELISDVLALARAGDVEESGDPVDPATVAREAWSMTEREGGTLVVEDSESIACDAGLLRQLFENLFRNAVEHGSTSNRSQARDDAVEHADDVTVRIGSLDGRSGFYVEDDGPGIPEDERDHVFEAGHSGDPDGTGLGLSIVAEIAEAHGWDVRARESSLGGARIEVTGVELAG